ncbi:MAG: acyl-CoA thioesterase [Paludibacteraceae bacterium]|nr:acyl-CoA thioesterase [Paludibacteraceae bacterium]
MELDNIEFNHSVDIQIRFNDIDVLGHVNNTVQLTYFDFGKVKYFEAVKGEIINWGTSDIVIVHYDTDFYEPIFSGNKIVVKTKIYEIGNKSLKVIQVLQDTETGHIKSTCRTVMCGFDIKTNTGIPISDEWRAMIQKYENFRP